MKVNVTKTDNAVNPELTLDEIMDGRDGIYTFTGDSAIILVLNRTFVIVLPSVGSITPLSSTNQARSNGWADGKYKKYEGKLTLEFQG